MRSTRAAPRTAGARPPHAQRCTLLAPGVGCATPDRASRRRRPARNRLEPFGERTPRARGNPCIGNVARASRQRRDAMPAGFRFDRPGNAPTARLDEPPSSRLASWRVTGQEVLPALLAGVARVTGL